MSPVDWGVILFRSVKYPLGSTTVCPDTESDTYTTRERDADQYYILIVTRFLSHSTRFLYSHHGHQRVDTPGPV